MLVLCRSEMGAQACYVAAAVVWGVFFIGGKGDRDKPPGVIMKSAIIITLMKFVQPQGKSEPDDPAFQIGLLVFEN